VEDRYNEARTKFRQGYIDTALSVAQESSQQLGAGDVLWNWRFRILEAEMFLWKGVPDKSLELVADDPPAGLPSEIIVRKKVLQGRALCGLGKSDQSRPVLNQAALLIPPAARDLQAELAFAQGKCAPAAEGTAQAYYQQASDFAHGVDPFVEANTLLYLGYFRLQGKSYDAAIEQFKRALALSDSMFLLKQRALGNLGYTYSQLGEFRRAASFSQQAVKIAADLGDRKGEEYYLIDVGREHFHQLEYADAEVAFSTALKLANSLKDEDGAAICLHDLAQLALKTKDLKKAEDYIRQLDGVHPSGGHYLDLLLNRAELAKARNDFPAAEQLLNQLFEQMASQRGIDPATRWTAQSDLAAVYAAQQKFDLADRMFREAVATAEATRSKIEGIEYRITFLDFSPFYDQYVKFLVSRNRPLEALAVAEQGRSPTLSEGLSSNGQARRLDITRIQAVLKRSRQIVLAYWLGWEESYLWVITPTQVELKPLPAELEIEKEIEAYNREIIEGGTLESLQKRGQGLYNTLVGPAEPFLFKDWGVIIVPHRKLYNLNFETLVVAAPPHFWIEDVASHSVSFVNALNSPRSRRSGVSKDLLLVGAPLLADKQFPVLKHAPAEMEKVAAHFPTAQEFVISGKDATPAAYLASNPGQFRYVHFVTHGTSSTVLENPLDSAIILSPAQGVAASTADPEASYHLYGKDIMKTPLHADLVIVSACYGMGREYSGEGLVGLAWAFLRAGAHQVIAALWEVDDASSPQLMDDFYAEYTHGKSAAEALRDAKLRMLHSNGFHKRPYYWASLQLYTGS
jgi:CHAT domain-containing protein/tetratricopeptide (TPR) repeat protein